MKSLLFPFTIFLMSILILARPKTRGQRRKPTSLFRQILPARRTELPAQRLLTSSGEKFAWIASGGRLQRVGLAS